MLVCQGRKVRLLGSKSSIFLCPGSLNFIVEILNVLEIGIIDNDLTASRRWSLVPSVSWVFIIGGYLVLPGTQSTHLSGSAASELCLLSISQCSAFLSFLTALAPLQVVLLSLWSVASCRDPISSVSLLIHRPASVSLAERPRQHSCAKSAAWVISVFAVAQCANRLRMSYRELLGFPIPAFYLSAGSPSLHCVHEWFLVAVFFCCGFCNKVLQTGCLRAAEVYRLIVPEAIDVWDPGQQGPAPPETFRELIPSFLFLASGAFLAVFGIPCFIDKSLQFLILTHLSSLCVCYYVQTLPSHTPGFSEHQSFSIRA